MSKDFISVKEAASLLDITPRWVQMLVKRGAIAAEKISGVWLVSRQSVLDYLEQKK